MNSVHILCTCNKGHTFIGNSISPRSTSSSFPSADLHNVHKIRKHISILQITWEFSFRWICYLGLIPTIQTVESFTAKLLFWEIFRRVMRSAAPPGIPHVLKIIKQNGRRGSKVDHLNCVDKFKWHLQISLHLCVNCCCCWFNPVTAINTEDWIWKTCFTHSSSSSFIQITFQDVVFRYISA